MHRERAGDEKGLSEIREREREREREMDELIILFPYLTKIPLYK